MKSEVGIVIPTWNSKRHLNRHLPPLLASPLNPRILIVDSSSTDGTAEAAREMGVEVGVIPQAVFNHGATREWARKKLGTPIIVMMTPDAYATDASMLEKLVAPLLDKQSSAVYARQIPHEKATYLEAFARHFNYPPTSHLRSLKDLSLYGSYLFFFSDSCAAYLNEALDDIGGFTPTLTGEDTVAIAKLLHAGHTIAYAAEARVHHSHTYTLTQEFKRHFDNGFARKSYWHLLEKGGADEKRGAAFVSTLFTQLLKEKPWIIPYAFLHCTAKWLGYRVGAMSQNAPVWWNRALSTQKSYWSSPYYDFFRNSAP